MPHYYGHTSAVHSLCPTIVATHQHQSSCPTIMAAHQQSVYCAPILRPHFSSPFIVPPLLWPHFSSPFIVPHYYGHTSAVHLLCPTITATLQQSIHCAPLLRPNISTIHHAPLLWQHTRSLASVYRSFDHIKNPVTVLPCYVHTCCTVRLPILWLHIIIPVVEPQYYGHIPAAQL